MAAALLTVGMGGCADGDPSLIVVGSPAFQQGECFADPNSSTFLQLGVLDVDYGTAYTLPIIVRNNLLARSSKTSSGVDDSELQLSNVEVSLSMDQAPEVLRRVRDEDAAFVSFSATVPSMSLKGGEETGVIVDVISDGASRALRSAMVDLLPEDARPNIEAELIFHATRPGGGGSIGDIESREYTFPIELCIGCLPVTCETCPDEQCPPDARFAGICGNAQDDILSPAQCDPLE
jgi:hypothetical protein